MPADSQVDGAERPQGWQACAAIVEQGDPDRFAAAMAAPVSARATLFPLYAFNVEVARAPWVTAETMIAEMRLQWWRDALGEIAAGGLVRRHEVVTELAHILRPAQAEMLDDLVLARRWDIYRDPFEDQAHFDRYLDHTAGHLMWVAVQALGGGEEAQVRRLARATGIAAFLRAIPALEAAGRVPLLDGRSEAVTALVQGALQDLAAFDRRSVARSAWPALIPAFAARSVLQQAQANVALVKTGLCAPEGVQRSWRLYRATRGRF